MAKLLERNLMGAEFARQLYSVTPPAGTQIEDMLEPDYWAHVSRKFNPRDIVEVVPEDGAFFARLFVVDCGKLWAKVHKLEFVELSPKEAKPEVAASEYEAKFFGPVAKWGVVKKDDGSRVSEESHSTREDADKWIEKFSKDMAA